MLSLPVIIVLVVVVILLSVGARFTAIFLPLQVKALNSEVSRGTVPILTWAGIRGGISVALALSLPESPERGLLLLVTYCVVLFSVIVQGLTVERVIKRYFPSAFDTAAADGQWRNRRSTVASPASCHRGLRA